MDENKVLKPIPVEANPPPGFWQRDAVYHPEPIIPMWRSVFLAPISAGFKHALSEYSAPVEGREYLDIGGWGYFRVVPPGGEDPRFPARIRGCVEFIRDFRELHFVWLWHMEWKPTQEARIEELQRVNLSAFSDAGLADHVSSALMSFLRESLRYQALLEVTFVWSLARLAVVCQELLRLDDGQIMALLAGLSRETSEQTRRLAELARLAAGNAPTRALLEGVDGGAVEKLGTTDPQFSAAFDAYLRDYGCRVLHHAIHYPTLKEKPAILLRLVRDQLARSFDHQVVDAELAQKRAAALAKARTALAERPATEKERFEKALESAEQVYPLKEGGEYATMDAPMALMRYALLEMGTRFVARCRMEHCDDVFFLELEEALQAFRNNEDLRELVTRRKAERAWVETHPGPVSYGKDPGATSGALPSEVQLLGKGIFWVMSQIYGAEIVQRPLSEMELHGMPASPGRYTGPARVIMTESDFGKLQAGDVLVCRITSPSWAVIFPSIGAIITDVGGILSHPAIIAREYRVPAVVATKNATSLLRDGQIVMVDGSAGTVEIQS